MLDIHLLREQGEAIVEKIKTVRHMNVDLAHFQSLDSQRKSLQVETQQLQAQRNQTSKAIGQAKAKGEDPAPILEQVANLGDQLQTNKQRLNEILEQLNDFMLGLPNVPADEVPLGKNEDDNLEVAKVGEPRHYDFETKPHEAIGHDLKMMDFELSAKITGSRFVVMKRDIARLHRALAQFMLNLHVDQHGYQEVYVPFIVNKDSLIGGGQLPKFEEDLFKLEGDNGCYLTSTGEVPIVNIIRDQILSDTELPLKMVAHTPCFRSEAGSYGKDTKGMIRQHQFEKVELIWVTKPEDSWSAHEALRGHAEAVLQALALPYRVVSLCGGDLGFTAAKTYDLEVWLPSQNCYREISSCSNCLDFQARRMQARFKAKGDKETQYVHTLNGSGLAVGRTLVAVLENYQTQDGGIEIPEVLRPYMNGQRKIEAK